MMLCSTSHTTILVHARSLRACPRSLGSSVWGAAGEPGAPGGVHTIARPSGSVTEPDVAARACALRPGARAVWRQQRGATRHHRCCGGILLNHILSATDVTQAVPGELLPPHRLHRQASVCPVTHSQLQTVRFWSELRHMLTSGISPTSKSSTAGGSPLLGPLMRMQSAEPLPGNIGVGEAGRQRSVGSSILGRDQLRSAGRQRSGSIPGQRCA